MNDAEYNLIENITMTSNVVRADDFLRGGGILGLRNDSNNNTVNNVTITVSSVISAENVRLKY